MLLPFNASAQSIDFTSGAVLSTPHVGAVKASATLSAQHKRSEGTKGIFLDRKAKFRSKLLQEPRLPWQPLRVGASFTEVLFTAGKFLTGLDMAMTAAGDVYGAGGAVVILMLWTNFSKLILLFGVQCTYVSSGAKPQPAQPML
jgi:hypothetical protein